MKIKEKFDLSEKVAIITGGAGLLGKNFARVLAEFGAKVVIADIDQEKGKFAVEKIKQEFTGALVYEYVDITQKTSVETLVRSVLKRFGKIDILVNNAAHDPKFEADSAGRNYYAFEDYPLELWEKAIAVNLTGAFLCCQAVGREMVSSGGGVIVNVASELGIIAPDQRIYIKKSKPEEKSYKPVDYPVAKAALIHMTKYLASYWGDKNIRVNSLCPAAVFTTQDEELVNNISYRTILGRLSQEDEFCGALIFLVSDASSYMTGANLVVDGGRSVW